MKDIVNGLIFVLQLLDSTQESILLYLKRVYPFFDYIGKGQENCTFLNRVDEQETIRIVQNPKVKISSDYNAINTWTVRTVNTQIVKMSITFAMFLSKQ